MNYGLSDLLTLLGALGFFIYGMKIMSEGIQKVAGSKMRNILRAMTSNRFKGVLTGFIITSLIQSSSATTVLVVSFVNAGLLSLVESIGVIMGANIGTTITAWLISIVGFKVKIAYYALPIIAFGTPLLFFSKDNLKSWGEVFIGFALLFLGLEYLKDSVPDLKANPDVLAFLTAYTDLGFISIIIFVAIGTLLTIILQSSSATMALTLVMANNGWIPFDLAAAMVLGENIGTTVTANLAAVVANVHAKRTAFAHFLFNVFGVIWVLILFYPALSLIDTWLATSQGESPYNTAAAIPIALSVFHTTFNVLNTLLLIGFIKIMASVATRVIKSDGEEEYSLRYIDSGLMSTAELSLEEAQKETARFGEITRDMSKAFRSLLHAKKSKKQKKLLAKIRKYEELTDNLEEAVSNYLLKVSAEGRLSSKSSIRVASLLSIVNDLERVGDVFFQMSKDMDKKIKEDLNFTEGQLTNLEEMMDIIDESIEIMVSNLNSSYDNVKLTPAAMKEQEIDKKRNKLLKQHLKQMEKKDYNAKIGALYKDIFHLCEKVGDHVINVTEAISGEREREIKPLL